MHALYFLICLLSNRKKKKPQDQGIIYINISFPESYIFIDFPGDETAWNIKGDFTFTHQCALLLAKKKIAFTHLKEKQRGGNKKSENVSQVSPKKSLLLFFISHKNT